jgi:creatinine amidohydrolase
MKSEYQEQPMRFEEMNWMDIEAYLKVDDRVMVVLGATEQHGYLSLLTDAKIPQALADAASQRSGVVVAPPLNFGVSPYFLAYPGTISLRSSTFLDVVEDMITSLYQAGFRRILVLNGHGGNDGAKARLVELANRLSGLKLSWYGWWQSHSVEDVGRQHGIKLYHAGWLEAFPFTIVSEIPDGDKVPASVKGILNAEEARQAYGDGVFGGAYQVDPAIMDELFAAALADVLYLLEF